MKKVVRLTESDLVRLVKKVLNEENNNRPDNLPKYIRGNIDGGRESRFLYTTQEMRGNIIKYIYTSDENKNCKIEVWNNGVYFYTGCGDNFKGSWKSTIKNGGWENVIDFYKNDKSSNFKLYTKKPAKLFHNEQDYNNGIIEVISLNRKTTSTKYSGDKCKLLLYSSGHATMFDCNNTGQVIGKWVSDSKESGGFKLVGFDTKDSSVKSGDVTKRASGYVTKSDTDFKTAMVVDNKIMGKGSKGDLVKKVQSYLVNNGYGNFTGVTNDIEMCKKSVDHCDGIYGGVTSQAVKKFQTDKNLKSKDGIVGKETIKAMGLL